MSVRVVVKDGSTIFCKKAIRRVAVAIATEQPVFVSCSSAFFFLTFRQKKNNESISTLLFVHFLLPLQTNTCSVVHFHLVEKSHWNTCMRNVEDMVSYNAAHCAANAHSLFTVLFTSSAALHNEPLIP